MVRVWILFLNVILTKGFLLQTSKPQNVSGQANVLCLTLSEYMADKQQQQHDIDRMFKILTSQVEQKLGEFENKIDISSKDNETNNLQQSWEQRYLDLEKKYAELQKNSKKMNSKLLQQEQVILNFQKKTNDIESKISGLENLKQIQSLQNISELQHRLQSVDTNVQSLRVNEQARSQDFLALYNVTIASKNRISEVPIQTNDRVHQVELQQNKTISHLNRQIEMLKNSTISDLNTQVKTLKTYFNTTIERLANNLDISNANESREINEIQNEIAEINNRVAVTACVNSDHTYNTGEIIKFLIIKTHTGGSGLAIQPTGKFTCRKKSVYLVSVWIMSATLDSIGPAIMKNGVQIVHSYFHHKVGYEKGTAIVALDLDINDEIWIQTTGKFEVDSWGSCMTISQI